MKEFTKAIIECSKKYNCSFLIKEEVEAIAEDEEARFTPILVRMNGGRFVCPVYCAEYFIGLLEATGKEYCRDVSLFTWEKTGDN
jgi:hypothetical protein